MKTSLLHPTVMASAILLGGWFHSEPVLADSCPAPSFADARTFDTGAGPRFDAPGFGFGASHDQSVAVGDFNGDGKPDLAVANPGNVFSQHAAGVSRKGNGVSQ